MGRPFYFRHFVIQQDRCAMKVGMDSMVLGAYVQPGNAGRILDIGTGSGVLALMMAQKSKAPIDAVEIDREAALQAAENVAASCWHHRIRVHAQSLSEFYQNCFRKYELIVTNPPYYVPFTRMQHDTSEQRHLARSFTELDFSSLIFMASGMLAAEGQLYIIVPANEKERVTAIAGQNGLYLIDTLEIKSMAHKKAVRAVLGFGIRPEPKQEHQLIVYQSPGQYTEAYKQLTAAFHAVSF